MTKPLQQLFLSLIIFLLIISCGNKSTTEVRQLQEQQDDEGIYVVDLTPQRNSQTEGKGIISVSDNLFSTQLEITGAAAATTHLQAVSYGPDCQGESAPYLFALDQEVTGDGSGTFPEADMSGNYLYQTSRSREELIEDLRLPDRQESDDFINLLPGERLNLGGKTLWILVSGQPVACGVLRRQ